MSTKNSVKYKNNSPSSTYSILSTAFVLFLLGALAYLLLNANAISSYFKENFTISVILNNDASENEVLLLENELKENQAIKSITYISKEEAKQIFAKTFNESFDDVLGYNPLYASFDLKLNQQYAVTDSLELLKTELEQKGIVKEFFYPKNIVNIVNKNLRFLGIIALSISLIFLFITVSLISNTIKLTMYSRRFLIKSMQMVGATKGFITAPFSKKSISDGIIASIIATMLLTLVLLYFQKIFPDLTILGNTAHLAIVIALIFFLGVLLSWWSTNRSVKKYLKLNLEELY